MSDPIAQPMDDDLVSVKKDQTSVVANIEVNAAEDPLSETAPDLTAMLMTQNDVKIIELSHNEATLIPPPLVLSMTQEDVNCIEGAESIEVVTQKLEVVDMDFIVKENKVEESVVDADRTLSIQNSDKPNDGTANIETDSAKDSVSGTDLVLSVKLLTQQDVEANEFSLKKASPIPSSHHALVTQEDVNDIEGSETGKDVAEHGEVFTEMLDMVVDLDKEQKGVEEAVVDADETLPIEDTDEKNETETSI